MSPSSSQAWHIDTGLASLSSRHMTVAWGLAGTWRSTLITIFCRQCLFILTLHDIIAFPLVFLCILASFWVGFPSFLKYINHWVGLSLSLYLNAYWLSFCHLPLSPHCHQGYRVTCSCCGDSPYIPFDSHYYFLFGDFLLSCLRIELTFLFASLFVNFMHVYDVLW